MLGVAQGNLVLSFFSSCHGKMLQQTQLPEEKTCLSSVYLIVCQVSYTFQGSEKICAMLPGAVQGPAP